MTKSIAATFVEEIISIHNLIPFQRWESGQLFSEGDEYRDYESKWQLSSICFIEGKVVGICIAFIDRNIKTSNLQGSLYLHRIAVHPKYRLLGIGKRLIKHSCQNYFSIPEINSYTSKMAVVVQAPTRSTIEFSNIENFYFSIGFRKIGEKKYSNRVDSILGSDLKTLFEKL